MYAKRDEGQPLLQGIDEQIDRHVTSQEMNKAISVQFLASVIVGVVEWWMLEQIEGVHQTEHSEDKGSCLIMVARYY